MNFIEGLLKSSSKDVILVVVDRLPKYAHFVAFSHPFTAATIANKFWKKVHCLHGTPESIVSDRDKRFSATFGNPYSNYWVLNYTLALLITLKVMVRLRELIGALRTICCA